MSPEDGCVHCGASRRTHDAHHRCTTRLAAVVQGVTFRPKPGQG